MLLTDHAEKNEKQKTYRFEYLKIARQAYVMETIELNKRQKKSIFFVHFI